MPSPRRNRAIAVRRWAVAVAVYLLAVFHRTSLGVAGLAATTRFGIGPGQLSSFVMLQLAVYAAMQIPTGVLVDRYGSRRLLLAAAALMATAQIAFALVPSYSLALLARGLLGCGDALTFVSVLRFAAGQFAPRRYPALVAATGALGALGNVVSTLPLTLALHSLGWTPTFVGAGLLSVLSGVVVYLVLPAPAPVVGRLDSVQSLRSSLARVLARVRSAWSLPGTRVGFWVHFTSMSLSLTFGVLWGVPFMVEAQGLSRNEASTILLANVALSVLVSPLLGLLVSRWTATRVPVAIGTAVVTVSFWLAVLTGFSRPMPVAVLVALALLTGLGGPVSAIGFSLARDYNGPAIVGTATGVVNVAGFLGSILACLGIGWVLDMRASTDLGAYRLAFGVAVAVQVAGLVQMVRWWLRARRVVLQAQDAGRPTPVELIRHRWDIG
ncbi:MFS transporter [Jatrophihabitans telluris]|uniref:MFS transporter n=1 Tax=Jatrophihabitans telluris TaxID=2038343 RepID=A0ABY4R2P1_9ACTN|nr:MFS transporter [Jatrophihabitans telluris]UQX89995.1 MFS transporter [Jatrophihabitans telluris]